MRTKRQPKAAIQSGISLVASENTYNPSLIVLREKGYDLWLESRENSQQDAHSQSLK